jgi:hypothetical protein
MTCSQSCFPSTLQHPTWSTMYHYTHVITKDEESTITLSGANLPSFLLLAHLSVPRNSKNCTYVPPSQLKNYVQLDLCSQPTAHLSKSVAIPAFCKKNGRLVASHTWQVNINKLGSTNTGAAKKKIWAIKKQGAVKFQALDDCKESVSLAHPLHVKELQNLLPISHIVLCSFKPVVHFKKTTSEQLLLLLAHQPAAG